MFAFSVAARFADPIVSLPPYQFARERFRVSWFVRDDRHGWKPTIQSKGRIRKAAYHDGRAILNITERLRKLAEKSAQ